MREFFSFTHTDGPMDEWFSHRSAKPSTAVRIRFGPHQNSVRNISNAVFLLFCTAFVRHVSIDYYLLYKLQLIYNR